MPRPVSRRALPGEPAGEKLVKRILRVDHAGEYGAKRIYDGQLAVLGDTPSGEARTRQWREIGLGAQILKDLGVSSIRLLTSSRRMTYVGLSGFGIEIVGTEPVER